jgi:hypothetical protein
MPWKLVAAMVAGFAGGVLSTLGWQNRGKIVAKGKEAIDKAKNFVARKKEEVTDEAVVQDGPKPA